ncbi:metal ABC transporter solute-binding protein, Zn/Mn family [Catalinimonas alkaloidigena]|uniref:metal ABC transporter solute-binding protein, Zn/Mn family n=1 Tax=Catalinimonas alkaloidigena TaxID=1075417 RepID=UPI002405EE34|nr:zinc ABC transporter substrate-binding protein [Catalinimonas alkaloidigena]
MRHLLWIFLAAFFISCSGPSAEDSQHKLYVVATTGMIADAAANIAGDSAVVEGLMGPGVDPHLYKATRSDLSKLREADIILYNGIHLEGKMGEVLEKLSTQKPVFAVADGIGQQRLIALEENVYDPHIWFDVSLWNEAVAYMGEKLAEVDTANATYYKSNTEAYTQKLAELHQWTSTQIESIPQQSRVLITAHDAFNYFGQAYDIEVRGLQGISTISEFGLKDISALVDFISERGIKAVFVESSVPSKSLESVVSGARERGHEVSIGGTLYSDALGEKGTDAGTYIGTVRANVNTIVASLK